MAEKKLTELFSMLPDMAMQGLDPKDIMNVLTGQDTSDQMYDASMFGGPNGGLGVGTESQLSEFDKVMDMTGDTEVAKEMAKLKAADDNEQAILNQIVKEDKLGDSAVKNVLGMNPSLIRMEQEAEMTGNVNLAAATEAVMEESDYTDLEELTDSYAAAFGVNKEDIVSNIKEITKDQPDPASDESLIKTISSQVLEEPLIPPPPQLLSTPPPGFGQAPTLAPPPMPSYVPPDFLPSQPPGTGIGPLTPTPMSIEEMYPDPGLAIGTPPPPPMSAVAQPQPVPQGSGVGLLGAFPFGLGNIAFGGDSPTPTNINAPYSPITVDDSMFLDILDPVTGLPIAVGKGDAVGKGAAVGTGDVPGTGNVPGTDAAAETTLEKTIGVSGAAKLQDYNQLNQKIEELKNQFLGKTQYTGLTEVRNKEYFQSELRRILESDLGQAVGTDPMPSIYYGEGFYPGQTPDEVLSVWLNELEQSANAEDATQKTKSVWDYWNIEFGDMPFRDIASGVPGSGAAEFPSLVQGLWEEGNIAYPDIPSLIGMFTVDYDDDLINFYYDPTSQKVYGNSSNDNNWKSIGQYAIDGTSLDFEGKTFTLNPEDRSFNWSEDLGLGSDVTAVSDLGIGKEVASATTGAVDGTTSMTAATAGIVDPTPFEGNPLGLWEALRIAQLGPKSEMPQWYSTRMQGFIPRFGDYLLSRSSRSDIFENYLKRTAKEKTSPTDAAANWDMAVKASRTIGSPEEGSDFARINTLQENIAGDNAKYNTLAILSSHLNINPNSYAGAGVYKRLGDMYDRYETRQAFKTGGLGPSGTFLSWISPQIAPRQPIEQPSFDKWKNQFGDVVNPDIMSPGQENVLKTLTDLETKSGVSSGANLSPSGGGSGFVGFLG